MSRRRERAGLSSFHSFNRLPTELRYEIWSKTLTPRIIDIYAFNKRLTSSQERSPIKDDRIITSQSPISILAVCRESRNFALALYQHSLNVESPTSARFELRKDEFPPEILKCWKSYQFLVRENFRRKKHPSEITIEVPSEIPKEIRPRIVFNLETDVLCLNRVWWEIGRHPLYPIRNYISPEILAGLRYLAMPFEMFDWAVTNDLFSKSSPTASDTRVTLADFPGLREIIINVDCCEDERELDLSYVTGEYITSYMGEFAERNPAWTIPKWRLVKDRKELGEVVEGGLLI